MKKDFESVFDKNISSGFIKKFLFPQGQKQANIKFIFFFVRTLK